MDDVLNLDRFAEERESFIAEKPGPGRIRFHFSLYKPFFDEFMALGKMEVPAKMFLENYKYFIGRISRSELPQYETKLEQDFQRLLIDEIDFANSVQDFKYENGRWHWPPEAIFLMHKDTAEKTGQSIDDVYKHREEFLNGKLNI